MTERGFISEPDPDNPGWLSWRLIDETRFNGQVLGKMLVRSVGPTTATTRMFPERKHTNLMDNLHGGTILSLIDVSMFSSSRMFGLIEAGTAVTLDLSVQFIGAAKANVPIDSQAELLRETRRLLFMRGLVVQDDEKIAAWSGTIRKPTQR